MAKLTTSPDRGQFVKNHINKLVEKGDTIIDNGKSYHQLHEEFIKDQLLLEQTEEWAKHNLEHDLRITGWICDKVKNSDVYAQNLYAALCNNDFTKNEVFPILADTVWGCSWRHAGGVIADMLEKGDYIDWYCSGMSDISGHVSEGTVTDEVRNDLLKLGWIVKETEAT